jgi:processive 1,2-diacylglycerol beta-glucosyltransferase
MSFVDEADVQLVYDDMAAKEAEKYGFDKKNLVKTGWWVRQEMYTKYDRQKVRKSLGFIDDRPVVFLGGGSLGTNSLTKILPTLMFLKKKVGFVVNTGTDEFTSNLVDEFVKLYKKTRKDDTVIIKNLGWIENMAEILSASDIVFGKAGPNFLFDVVASQKPFVAITHIGGQEDGNIELIKKKKLGWIEEKNGEIYKFLMKYLENPKLYQNKYLENIKNEALINQKSLPLVLEMVKNAIK